MLLYETGRHSHAAMQIDILIEGNTPMLQSKLINIHTVDHEVCVCVHVFKASDRGK